MDHRDYGDENEDQLSKLARNYRKERVPYSTYLYVKALEERIEKLQDELMHSTPFLD